MREDATEALAALDELKTQAIASSTTTQAQSTEIARAIANRIDMMFWRVLPNSDAEDLSAEMAEA